MPDDFDEERAIVSCGYQCSYCDNLCDVENLRCKACANVFHIECLYNRGHLNSIDIPIANDWTCSDCVCMIKLVFHS
jgi:hypothetical protein